MQDYGYLQGSQTAGLFQPAPQNSIPSINGAQNYVPGQGMAPYAASSASPKMDINQFLAMHKGQNQIEGLWQQYLAGSYNPGSGTMSTIPMVSGTPSSATASSSSGPTIGGSDPWLSNSELMARGQAFNPDFGGQQTSGSYGGGSVGGVAGQTTGQSSGLFNGQQSVGDSSPQLSGVGDSIYPNQQSLTYQSPQGGSQGGAQGGALQMQQQAPQDALAAYQNTPGYQLLGNNQAQQFQASPGYQYAVNEAMRNVQGNASARGLLESGAALRGMTDRAQGMASQDYNNWWNQQNQLYNNYQNRLAGLAGGNVGGDQAFNLGQAQAAGTMQTGNNVASLFGNQGAAGYGGLVNTGAAQSGNITNAGAQQAQVQSANQSTQLAGAVYNRGLF